MAAQKEQEDMGLFRSGKAAWLEQGGVQSLDAEQRALLLALTQLEQELGRELTPEEQAAIESLGATLQKGDAADIIRAVREMVQKPTDPKRRTDWSELRRKQG